MRFLLVVLSLVAITACAPEAKNLTSQPESLMDVASPEEVAEELGLSEEPSEEVSAPELNMTPMSLEQHNRLAKIDLTQHFPVVILVNKATKGPSAQTMKVYHRGELVYQFLVSTGREKDELAKSGRRYFSTTPVGWFAPTKTYEKYFSNTWQAWMNYSVFFIGGIATHATTPDHYKELGTRASGGCVRLTEKNAKIVYDLILSEDKGEVPVFTRDGSIKTGLFGKIKTQESWNTLIIVEDNPKE
ncbi:L,D-transpeptidase [Bdellovibrio sp. HCB337]|uniref:L,D-transpeptidase n=1 Tax=Bdellovibrio sp. HCB337 TaxID=3394358 RepID=UPI0039A7058D